MYLLMVHGLHSHFLCMSFSLDAGAFFMKSRKCFKFRKEFASINRVKPNQQRIHIIQYLWKHREKLNEFQWNERLSQFFTWARTLAHTKMIPIFTVCFLSSYFFLFFVSFSLSLLLNFLSKQTKCMCAIWFACIWYLFTQNAIFALKMVR